MNPLWAQDTTQSGVRVGITYTPGTRPSLVVMGGTDSARAIVTRDLDQSDRFEMSRQQPADVTDAAGLSRLGVA